MLLVFMIWVCFGACCVVCVHRYVYLYRYVYVYVYSRCCFVFWGDSGVLFIFVWLVFVLPFAVLCGVSCLSCVYTECVSDFFLVGGMLLW